MKAPHVIIAAAAVVLILVSTVPFLFTADKVAAQLRRHVETQTGRDLQVRGDAALSFVGGVTLVLHDVTVPNPPDMATGHAVAIERMQVTLGFLSLITGNLDISQVVLVRPYFNFLIAASGSENWDIRPQATVAASPGGRSDRIDAARSGPATVAGADGARPVAFGPVHIIEGTLSYADERNDTRFIARDLNATVNFGPQDELLVDGQFDWRGVRTTLSARLDARTEFLDTRTANVGLELSSVNFDGTFAGKLSLARGFALEGSLKASTDSLRRLAAWAGKPLGDGSGLGPFSLAGPARLEGAILVMQDGQYELDGARARGELKIDLRGARPRIEATAGINRIDLARYLPRRADGSASARGRRDAAIDLSGLDALDAHLKLSFSRLEYGRFRTDGGTVDLTIRDRLLRARFGRTELYGGATSGYVVVNGAGERVEVAAGFDVLAADALALFRDTVGVERLEGLAGVSFRISTSGTTRRELVAGLGGHAKVLVKQGALRGINVGQVLGEVENHVVNGWPESADAQTTFDSLSANFAIADGTGVNHDLTLIGPMVRVAGGGSIDFAKGTIAFRCDPRIVSFAVPTDEQPEMSGLNVPLVVKGPWDDPSIYPDIDGILENPAEAYLKLRRIGDTDAFSRYVEDMEAAVPRPAGTGSVEAPGEPEVFRDGEVRSFRDLPIN